MTDDELATLACQRGKKREACPCQPCATRRAIFGANVPVQVQERARAIGGDLKTATQAALEEAIENRKV